MTELATVLPPYAPLQSEPHLIDWQGYSASSTRADVRAAFYRKFGYRAATVKVNGGCVLVGPIVEGGNNGRG